MENEFRIQNQNLKELLYIYSGKFMNNSDKSN